MLLGVGSFDLLPPDSAVFELPCLWVPEAKRKAFTHEENEVWVC